MKDTLSSTQLAALVAAVNHMRSVAEAEEAIQTRSEKHNKRDYLARLMEAMEEGTNMHDMELSIEDGKFILSNPHYLEEYEFPPVWSEEAYERLVELETDLEGLQDDLDDRMTEEHQEQLRNEALAKLTVAEREALGY